ncbi:MAG TPA: hypothetical protein VFR47_20870 [Anaerolineales bacterium]|nr:hypothetical protein [Anaerolineales bacterium]
MRLFVLLLITISVWACAAQPVNTLQPIETSLPSTASEAYDALVNFLTRLHTGNYADAVQLYGGPYEQLQVFNPEIDPNDHIALLAWACDHQLLQCLELRSATFQKLVSDTYVFQVEFSNPDGSLFVLGPCCGANETEMPPVSQFEYMVTRNSNGKFVVMDLPPYVP